MQAEPFLSPWIAVSAPDEWSIPWPEPQWIAADPAKPTLGEAFYRAHFRLDDPLQIDSAALRLLGKNRTDVHLNGHLLKRCVHWVGVYEIDLSPFLKKGKNVLALHAIDREGDQPIVGPTLALRQNGQIVFPLTASSWRTRPASAPSEWTQVWYDDRSWSSPCPPPTRPSEVTSPPPAAPRSLELTKTFHLGQLPTQAVVRVSALGMYDLQINHQPASDQLLTPGWTEYDLRLEYQTFDVTKLLRKGDNLITLTLGNGWWMLHLPGLLQAGHDCRLCATLQMDCDFSDGSCLQITTDPSWTARPSAVLFNHLYHGEVRDCAWNTANAPILPLTEVPPPTRSLVPQAAEPIRCTARLAPQSVVRTSQQTWLLDFGENLAGWIELPPPQSQCPVLTITHAELLRPDGSLNSDTLRTARQTTIYRNAHQATQPLAPRFTYHGFRYAEIHGWPDPTPPTAVACLIHADLHPTGSFTCSEPLLNDLFAATRRTFRNNFHAVPTDCPQRDERLGWMADAGNIPDVAACFYNVSRFFHKWATDMDDAMAKSGFFPNFSPPMNAGGHGSARGTPGWSDAGVTVPWVLYDLYRDRDHLAAHYPFMRRHVETLWAESRDGLFLQKGWGDWLAIEESPQEPIGTAYFYRSTNFVARAARVLERATDARHFEALASQIASAYQRAYYNPTTGDYANGTQTMQAMPLAFGITPASERPRVFARLLTNLEEHEWHLTTGFLGTTFLFDALAAERRHDVVLRLLRQEDFPSLGRLLRAGSTTITESWNAHLGDDFASHDHFNLGAPTAWLLRHLAGMRPIKLQPGHEEFHLEPFLAPDVDHAHGSWNCLRGTASVHWQRSSEGTVLYQAILPEGASGMLHLPDRDSIQISAGQHEFLIEAGSTSAKAASDG